MDSGSLLFMSASLSSASRSRSYHHVVRPVSRCRNTSPGYGTRERPGVRGLGQRCGDSQAGRVVEAGPPGHGGQRHWQEGRSRRWSAGGLLEAGLVGITTRENVPQVRAPGACGTDNEESNQVFLSPGTGCPVVIRPRSGHLS